MNQFLDFGFAQPIGDDGDEDDDDDDAREGAMQLV